MKECEVQLQRLFAAARQSTPAPEHEAMPGHLRTRVLAHWRSGGLAGDVGRGLALMFRGALACAAAVMLVSIVWSFSAGETENDVALANFELRTDVMP